MEQQLNRRTPTRPSLQLFGGEVEICDGFQRTVLRIEPSGFVPPPGSTAAAATSAAAEPAPVSLVSVLARQQSNLSGGGVVVQVQSRLGSGGGGLSFAEATSALHEDARLGVVKRAGCDDIHPFDAAGVHSPQPPSPSIGVKTASVAHVPYVPGTSSLISFQNQTRLVGSSYPLSGWFLKWQGRESNLE